MSRKCPWCEWTTMYAEGRDDDMARRSNDSELAGHKAMCAVGRLRDRFAMAALTGSLAFNYTEEGYVGIRDLDERQARAWADEAYLLADAMLAAREATS